MFQSLLGGKAQVEEHLVEKEEEENLTNTSSDDASETEEHITIHPKREPLPWSLRGPLYQKPLPGISSDSPTLSDSNEYNQDFSPQSPSPLPQNLTCKALEEEPLSPSSPLGGPFSSVELSSSPGMPFVKNIASPVVIAEPSPIRSSSALFEENSPPKIGRPLSGFDEEAFVGTAVSKEPSDNLVIQPEPNQSGPSQSGSLLFTTAIAINVQSPLSPAHVRSPAPEVDHEAPLLAEPLSPKTEWSSSSKDNNNTSIPYLPDLSSVKRNFPEPNLPSLFGTNGIPCKTTPSPATIISPIDLERGVLSPVKPISSPTVSLGTLEAGLSPQILGEKGAAIIPKLVTPPLLENQGDNQKVTCEGSPEVNKLRLHYIKDWKVIRKYRPEEFFFAPLFNPVRLQYLQVPRKRHPIPRKFQCVQEDTDPGNRYRRDWRVERQYPIYKYFNPKLFEEGRLKRIKIPISRHQMQRRFRERMLAMGIKDLSSPAAYYRLNWGSSRRYPVEHFFEPSLFESITTEGEKLRSDWYSVRKYRIETFMNPKLLFDEKYQHQRLLKTHQMIKRLTSPTPRYFQKTINRNHTDPGQRYRDDWRVHREYDVYEFFEPSLFDKEKAWLEASILSNQMIAGQMPKEHSVTPPRVEDSPQVKLINESLPPVPLSPNATRSPSLEVVEGDSCKVISAGALESFEALCQRYGDTNENCQEYDWNFWRDLLESKDFKDDDQVTLLRHLREPKFAGLPVEIRGRVWTAVSGAKDSPHLYAEYEMLREMPSAWEDSIASDVYRMSASGTLNDQEALAMHHILGAYSSFDPDTGYIPALADIVTAIVKVVPEADAFVLLTCIMQNYDHRKHLQPDLNGCGPLLFELEQLLIDYDPELALHLQSLDMEPEIYAQDWYASLMAPLGVEFQQNTIEVFLLTGNTGLHQLALTLLIENRDELLEAENFATAMSILTGDLLAVHSDWDASQWVRTALGLFIPPDDLSDLANRYSIKCNLLDEQQIFLDLSFLEGEHDYVLWYLSETYYRVREICLGREYLASALHSCKESLHYLKAKNYTQARTIAELEQRLSAEQRSHADKVHQLTTLLCAQSLENESSKSRPTTLFDEKDYCTPALQQKGSEKILKL